MPSRCFVIPVPNIFLLLIFLSFCIQAYSQRNVITFYDSSWYLTSREHAAYYRVGVVDTIAYKYYGEVKEYYKDGKPLLRGTFKASVKQDTFYLHYPNGKLETKGVYQNDIRKGTWMNYYASGGLRERIVFDDIFTGVKDSFDENGDPRVINGNGKWKTEYYVADGVLQIVEGAFKEGHRDGLWKYSLVDNVKGDTSLQCTENYKNGRFVSGKFYDQGGRGEKIVSPRMIVFPELARFKQWGSWQRTTYASQKEYPHLKFLPLDHNVDTAGYAVVKTPASWKGGLGAMADFVGKNLRYPSDARAKRKQGTVKVSFLINADGSVDQESVKAISTVYPSLDEEAVRLVRSFPTWYPGVQNGKPVRSKFVFPVIFRLP